MAPPARPCAHFDKRTILTFIPAGIDQHNVGLGSFLDSPRPMLAPLPLIGVRLGAVHVVVPINPRRADVEACRSQCLPEGPMFRFRGAVGISYPPCQCWHTPYKLAGTPPVRNLGA